MSFRSPIGVLLYDWEAFEKEIGVEEASAFYEVIHANTYLEIQEIDERRVLTWTTGSPRSLSHMSLEERWASPRYTDEQRSKYKRYLDQVTDLKIGFLFVTNVE
jgi:hypothetical protein